MSALALCATNPDRWQVPDVTAGAVQVAEARRAVAECHDCPLFNTTCGDTMSDRDRAGWIVNGIPYHPRTGLPLPRCRRCGGWCFGRKGDAWYCNDTCYNQARGARARQRELAASALIGAAA